MKLVLALAVLVAGCSAESASWFAHTSTPVRIDVDTFSALCVYNNINATNSTVFQWMNGTEIVPKGRYSVTMGLLTNQTLADVINSNLTRSANLTWTVIANATADGTSWYAQIVISAVARDEVGGLLCANRSVLTVDSYAYVAMGAGMKSSKNVIQGDEYCLACEAYGSPLPNFISWYRNGNPLELSSRVNVTFQETNTTVNSTLRFSPVEFEDDADYTCYSVNAHGVSNNVTMSLRVKDRWAALWPFLGIVAEVIVLCAIILLYEKRQQSKLAAEEDDKDRSTLMNDGVNEKDDHDGVANGGDEVRQRPIIKS